MIIEKPRDADTLCLRSLWKEAFGDSDAFIDSFWETAFSFDRCRCAKVEGVPVSALYWFDCSYRGKRLAYLYAIATKKAYRGRGICRALMEDTHRYLSKRGYDAALLVPGSRELFDFYQRAGYSICGYVSQMRTCASETGCEVREIDSEEYAHIRALMLDDKGVVQENENLRFLKTQATFYTGEGFLLAARQTEGTLHGLELLGDRTAAPKILRTLGCEKGIFRTPGSDVPFSMYVPLSDAPLVTPLYFGIAFD